MKKTPMPKSSGSDARAGANKRQTGMGRTSKPASYSLPPVKTNVKRPRGSN